MVLALLLFAAATAQPVAAAPLPSPEPTAGEALHLGSDADRRMTLQAEVNGHGPFAFTIDTGADRSVVSDALATELALPADGTAALYGIEGRHPVDLVRVGALRFGRREHRNFAAPVLPRPSLGAQGFIGLDALAGETVVLDFRTNRIVMARSPEEAMIRDPGVIVVTGRSRFGQLILTDARIGTTKVYAIIDTGAASSIGNLALRSLMGRSGPLDDKGVRVIGVTGAEMPGEATVISEMHLGELTVGSMPIVYADVDTFRRFGVGDKPAVLIGMDVLRRFERVAVDFRRRSVRFRIGAFDGGMIAAASPKANRATTRRS